MTRLEGEWVLIFFLHKHIICRAELLHGGVVQAGAFLHFPCNEQTLAFDFSDDGVLGLGTGGAGDLSLIWVLGLQMIGLVLFGGFCGSMNNVFVHISCQNIGNAQGCFSSDDDLLLSPDGPVWDRIPGDTGDKRCESGTAAGVHLCARHDPHPSAYFWQYVLYVPVKRFLWPYCPVCVPVPSCRRTYPASVS